VPEKKKKLLPKSVFMRFLGLCRNKKTAVTIR
jgi:hypothetical protein